MAGLTLHMTRVLPAPPARVFRLRVGGAYRFAMQPPEGAIVHLTGEFREVEPPARVAYTFRWEEPDPEDVETLVTLSLRDLGGATELTFTQGVFATERRRALHEGGWTEGLVRLERVVAGAAS